MNSLNLRQIDGGNIIKQADSGSLFKFELLDENHKKFEEQLGDTATVILKKDTVAVFKKIVAATDNYVAFNLDKILEVGDYILEIIVGEYVFPSNNRLKISVESTYGDYQPENLVRITYEEIDEKINALTDRLEEFNVAGQTEMLRRIEKLESKEDKDTIYDDTEIKQSVTDVDTKVDNLSEKVTALEERPTVDTALTKRVEALERKEDRDTVYDDAPIIKRIETLEQKEDKDTIYNDTEIKNRLVSLEQKEDKDTVYDDSRLVERIENLESDDTTIKERISALEDKPNKDTVYDDSNLKAQIAELESKLQSLNTVRHAPTGYTLDRTTTPWTVRFDNGCGLQMSEYGTTATVYGYGFSASYTDNSIITFPIIPNIMRVSNGSLTIEKIKTIKGSADYWSPSIKIINPIRDRDDYDWANARFNPEALSTNHYSSVRQQYFIRTMYELGIWSESDVEGLGATKK